jgi:hypothetical protein
MPLIAASSSTPAAAAAAAAAVSPSSSASFSDPSATASISDAATATAHAAVAAATPPRISAEKIALWKTLLFTHSIAATIATDATKKSNKAAAVEKKAKKLAESNPDDDNLQAASASATATADDAKAAAVKAREDLLEASCQVDAAIADGATYEVGYRNLNCDNAGSLRRLITRLSYGQLLTKQDPYHVKARTMRQIIWGSKEDKTECSEKYSDALYFMNGELRLRSTYTFVLHLRVPYTYIYRSSYIH